uniref:Uncharacterized protein n=1 Tax=Plectus sambesii TaxID=2011161 RepID=A0A914UN45_9BILA
MPTLKAFGRRWSIASDDFVFPQITEGILRCFWFFAALFIYVLHTQPKKCPEGSIADLSTFIVVLLVHNGVLVVICFMTAYVSSRGTIMNSTPRRFLPQFIYLRVPIFVFEVIWNIVGTVWIAEDRPPCHDSVILGTRLTIIMNWLIIAAFVLGVVVVFHPLGAMQQKEHNLTVEKTRRLWRRRVRWMCICANADDHAKVAFEDVADLMSCFFSDNDLVLSDVWAGLLLLANNDLRVMNDRQVVEPDVRDKPEWMNVQFATRMLDFAIGVYGWPTYTLN